MSFSARPAADLPDAARPDDGLLRRLRHALVELLASPSPPHAPSLLDGFRPAAWAVVLHGCPGSGRRRLALEIAGELRERGGVPRGPVLLLPATASRLRVVQRQVMVAAGSAPPALADAARLRAGYRAALAPTPGCLIVDARHGAELAVVDALAPPAGWTTLVLAPAGADRLVPGGLDVALPAPADGATADAGGITALRARSPAHDALLTAAAYADPWEGVPAARLLAAAGLATGGASGAAAIADAIAAGALIELAPQGRLAPSLHLVVARPQGAARGDRERAVERAALATLATLVAPALHQPAAREPLWNDRGALITALAVLRDWAAEDARAAAAGARSLEGALAVLLPDPTAHAAAAFLIDQLAAAGPDADGRYRVQLYRQMLAAPDPP